jgi:V/A-type H+-transporting ATPase subunit E
MTTISSEPADAHPRVSGVQELIDRLRREGVTQGRSEAEALVIAAREEATRVLDTARREAEQITAAAQADAQRLKAAAEDSLRLAVRDAVLTLEEALRADFSVKLRRLIAHTMEDREFLERLILEVARRAMPEDTGQSVEVLLPSDTITYEELQRDPKELAENSLSRFVLDLASDVLREGLTFAPDEDPRRGLRISIKDQDIEIDLTEQAVTTLLMDHLAPRFRALMDGPKS